jgi:hypothetical protein
MATGSNDKTVKLMRFNTDTSNLEGNLVSVFLCRTLAERVPD